MTTQNFHKSAVPAGWVHLYKECPTCGMWARMENDTETCSPKAAREFQKFKKIGDEITKIQIRMAEREARFNTQQAADNLKIHQLKTKRNQLDY